MLPQESTHCLQPLKQRPSKWKYISIFFREEGTTDLFPQKHRHSSSSPQL